MQKINKRLEKAADNLPQTKKMEDDIPTMLSKLSPFQRRVAKRVLKKLKKKYPNKEFPELV
tara:strand:+ start:1178 stop:1360 length:183 start_codon:yes stop_codon:yes gene_type:complete